jgi:hypothetical protein
MSLRRGFRVFPALPPQFFIQDHPRSSIFPKNLLHFITLQRLPRASEMLQEHPRSLGLPNIPLLFNHLRILPRSPEIESVFPRSYEITRDHPRFLCYVNSTPPWPPCQDGRIWTILGRSRISAIHGKLSITLSITTHPSTHPYAPTRA